MFFIDFSLCSDISIHAPRAGGDVARRAHTRIINEFQSTPPVRGATAELQSMLKWVIISIHAPRAGGDVMIRKAVAIF